MITLIKNVDVYAPERLGGRDVLLVGGKIAAVGEHLEPNVGGAVEIREIEAGGKIARAGFHRFPRPPPGWRRGGGLSGPGRRRRR